MNCTRTLMTSLSALIALAALVALSACHSGASEDDAIRHLEDRMGTCMQHQDAPCLDSLLAPQWTARWGDGSWQTKADYLASVAKHNDHYASVTSEGLTVTLFGDTAVVRGIDREKATFSGKDGSGRYAWMDVFSKSTGQWRLVASQSTRLQ
jgi:hypothetical protein